MMTVHETTPGSHEVRLEENFTFESHKEFRQLIKDLKEEKPKQLTLNFSNTGYLDSAALGMLMLAKHEMAQIGCPIVFTGLKPGGPVHETLRLVKFDQQFQIV